MMTRLLTSFTAFLITTQVFAWGNDTGTWGRDTTSRFTHQEQRLADTQNAFNAHHGARTNASDRLVTSPRLNQEVHQLEQRTRSAVSQVFSIPNAVSGPYVKFDDAAYRGLQRRIENNIATGFNKLTF